MMRHIFHRSGLAVLALCTWLLAFIPVVQADVQFFDTSSLKKIEAAHQGEAFILGFWSAGCTHCPAELRTLGALSRRYPALKIVLVAADTPADAPLLGQLAADYGLDRHAQWVFADTQPERLRMAIDRRWFGELPRTYFYDARHQREGRSGVIPAEELERWVRKHVK